MKLPKWFTRLIDRFLTGKRYFRGVNFVDKMSDLPDELGKDAFVVRKGGRDVWLVFRCPCDVNHRLTINLSRARHPSWSVQVKEGALTVYPSVWVTDTCRSHFWIRNSEIVRAYSRDEIMR